MGIKPQDFIEDEKNNEIEQPNQYRKQRIRNKMLQDNSIRASYLLWYPLIAACSFIRTNKNDPFAAEYILPQLLMQWVRGEMMKNSYKHNQLVGIRYFSCASKRASEMGFNYVFPSCGQKRNSESPYCNVLTKAFRVTEPVYIHEYEDVLSCERDLIKSNNMDVITAE